MDILVFLYRKNKPMRTIDIFEVLRDRNEVGSTHYSSNSKAKETQRPKPAADELDKTILSKLERDKLIVREKSGRNVFVTLTESGRYVACLSGLLE